MRGRWKKILCLALLFFLMRAEAQWQPTNGPLAGTYYATSIIQFKDRLFIGLAPGGIFSCPLTDFHWTGHNVDTASIYVMCLANTDSLLFAGTQTGLYISSDAGQSWRPSNSGLTDKYVKTITVKEQKLFIGTPHGLFVSIDKGKTWALTSPSLSDQTISAVCLWDNRIVAGFGSNKVYVTSNDGISWDMLGVDFKGDAESLQLINNVLYGCSIFGFLKFLGNRWTDFNSGLPIMTGSYDIIRKDNLMIGACSQGIVYYDASGTWRKFASSPGFSMRFLTVGSRTFAAGSGVYYLDSDWTAWRSACGNLTGAEVVVLQGKGRELFAGTNSSGIFYTSNAGAKWNKTSSYSATKKITEILCDSPNVYISALGGGLQFSANYGLTWQTISPSGVDSVTAMCRHGNSIFLSAEKKGLYKSTDGGITWGYANRGISGLPINTFLSCSDTLFAGTASGGFFRTDNGGESWIKIGTQDQLLGGINKLYQAGAIIYAATNNGTYWWNKFLSEWEKLDSGWKAANVYSLSFWKQAIIASTNKGVFIYSGTPKQWKPFNEGLIPRMVKAALVSDDTLYAGVASSGVWKRDLTLPSGIGENKITEDIPSDYELNVYPNPFNGSTRVEYLLPEAGNVKLHIVNLLGQTLFTANEKFEYAGKHTFTLDASSLSSGVYFLRFETFPFSRKNRTISLKKIILLK